MVNSNLLFNASFEENDNSHWDKWYTGSIEMTNMLGTTNVARHGRQSMEIRLQNKGNNSSIAQFNQYGIPDSSVAVKPGALYSFGGFFKSGGLTQPTEHWFEWSSTKTAGNTNERPSLPWPNYFTPSLKAGTAPTAWTYANRVLTMPAGFPNIELRHRYTTTQPVSGSVYIDDVFFRELPPLNSPSWSALVPFNAQWRFRTGTPPANWFASEFNDSLWPIGRAKFGAGDGPNSIVTSVPQFQSHYYFRRNFWCETAQLDELLLAATCTDDYRGVIFPLRIWINGAELLTTGIETVSGQGNQVQYYDLSPFINFLRPGNNSIAVMLRNTWADGWDDVAFDVSLRAISSPRNASRLNIESAGLSGAQLTAETPAGSIWKIQSSDRLVGGTWQTLQTFTSLGAPWTYHDPRPATPPLGPLSPRFYRLTPYR